jgi:hypothetical protein
MWHFWLLHTSTFRLREPATFRALCPSTSRTTDFCSFGCPDDICSILLLDIEGHRTLTLTFACSLTLPRPTTTALAARTTPAALSCSTFWVLWCPRPRRTSPTWLAALFAARKLHDRSPQSHTAQRPSSLQPRLPPGTQPGFDNLSHWLRPLDKTARSKWYRAYLETMERGDYLVYKAAFWPPWGFLLQGFSPRMHGSRVAATGDLRGSWTSCLRVWKAT